jgi:cystathionine beta-lyase
MSPEPPFPKSPSQDPPSPAAPPRKSPASAEPAAPAASAEPAAPLREATRLAHLGNDPHRHHGIVNPPVYHASTILYPDYEAYKRRYDGDRRYTSVTYGLNGTPTTFALADAVAAIEGGHKAVAVSSGLAAIALALCAFTKGGDHLLVTDTAYGPTRTFCDKVLTRYGVETTYYDPLAGAGIVKLFRPNTRAVFLEAPGSLTFEMQDIPAIAQAARARGALTVLDNTWASPLFFKPFAHGVDVSVQAGTKYISGHSDVMLGTITVDTEAHFRQVKDTVGQFGDCPGPDDCYLALRGLRTLAVRLKRHEASALHVARWLQDRPEVKRVLYPALPGDPGHALWKRDFLGASGLFGVVLHTADEAAAARFIDALKLFQIGASWGGYESLVIPAWPGGTGGDGERSGQMRTATRWTEPGFLIRLHVGLEDPGDLIEDLRRGFEAMH